MISDKTEIAKIRDAFQKISQIYIADGHHRAASAVKVSLKRRKKRTEHGEHNTCNESDHFLSVLFAENELCIMDYNRVISDLNGYTKEEFQERVKEVYQISEVPEGQQAHPSQKGMLGMYLDGRWYELHIRETYCSQDPVLGLDVSSLQQYVLDPILGIQDPKTDKRISFVGGIRGLEELEQQTDRCGGVAFAMYPTSMEELFAVADAGRLMPPKSTWFEPKLRSGLFIHSIKEA